MSVTERVVVIAGGGRTGPMLAGELALAGVDVGVVERRRSQDLPCCLLLEFGDDGRADPCASNGTSRAAFWSPRPSGEP